MSRPSEYGYLFLVPEAMTKAEYMLRMYEDCIFPALIRERDALPKVPGAPTPRIRHFMDGDHGPLQAINSMMDMLEAQLIDCIKSSAGTSAIEQANDAMRAFMMLRKLLKSWRYVYNEQEYQAHPIGAYVTVAMEAITRATDLSAEKRRILKKFFDMCPVLLPSAFTLPCIIKGWRLIGLYPFSLRTILQQTSTVLTDEDYTRFVDALPVFIRFAIDNGKISEELFDQYNIVMVKKVAIVQNSKRCLWLNHQVVRAENVAYLDAKEAEAQVKEARIQAKAVVVAERARVAALTPEERAAEAKVVHDAKEEQKAAAKQEKDAAKEKEVAGKKAAKDAAKEALRAAALVQRAAAAAVAEAAEPKAPKQRKRVADEAAASAAPRKKAAVTYYCANPFCETTSVTAESWSMCGRCPQDLARGWFCPSDACQAMLAAHELICTK